MPRRDAELRLLSHFRTLSTSDLIDNLLDNRPMFHRMAKRALLERINQYKVNRVLELVDAEAQLGAAEPAAKSA
jgi:hypothetical protein